MSELKITNQNFEAEVLSSDKPVLLDFWATWCGPCRMLSPVISEIAEDHPEFKVGKVNVDEESELASAFGVASIPTLVIIKNGKIVSQSAGYKPKADIESMMKTV